MDDRLILVDLNGRETGTDTKEAVHRQGLLHRAFSVFLIADDRLLIQRRAAHKYHSGGLWANACCSHPRQGETIADAASRRLWEELGVLGVDLRELYSFVYRHEFADGLVEYEYDHVLLGEYCGAVTPNPDEASECAWVCLDELREDLVRNPARYAVWFLSAAPAVLRTFYKC